MTKTKTASDVLEMKCRLTSGYGYVPKMVMQDIRLTPESKAIYAYFCGCAGAGTTAFPSLNEILSDLQISKDRYIKHSHILERCGYIKSEQSGILSMS